MKRQMSGFTLVEVLASMIVLSIIASSAALLIGRTAAIYRDRAVQGELHTEASVTLDRIVREIRGLDTKLAGTVYVPDITAASTTSLSWGSSGTSQLIDLNSGNIRINTDGVNTDTLVSDVSQLAFDYLDENGVSLLSGSTVPASKLANIQRVKVNITLSRGGQSSTLHTLVFLRGLTNTTA